MVFSVLGLLLALTEAGQTASPPPAPRPPVITNPRWVRRPSGEDLERYYPDLARDRLVAGRAMIECVVEPTGAVSNCSVLSETPRGWGFGAATVQASRLFRMTPTTVDGGQISGAKIRIPMIWRTYDAVPIICTDKPAAERKCSVNPLTFDATFRRRGLDAVAVSSVAGREPSATEKRAALPGFFTWYVTLSPDVEACPAWDGQPRCDGPGA